MHLEQQLGRTLAATATQLTGNLVRLPDTISTRRAETQTAHVVHLLRSGDHSQVHISSHRTQTESVMWGETKK